MFTAWVSFDPALITQTIAEAKERRSIVLSYLYPGVGNNVRMLSRKLGSSLLQGMDTVWVPRASKPDAAGGDDALPGRAKGKRVGILQERGSVGGVHSVMPSKPLQGDHMVLSLMAVSPDTMACHLWCLGLSWNLSLRQTLHE